MSKIKSRPATNAYREGWDRAFWRPDRKPVCAACCDHREVLEIRFGRHGGAGLVWVPCLECSPKT